MPASATSQIGIVLYPGAQAACIHGLSDLFGIASRIALGHRRPGRPAFRITHWQAEHGHDAQLSCVYDSAPSGAPQPRILIIPPTMVNLPDPDIPAGAVSWLLKEHSAGATLVSICSGAFILAETGLANGRSVATHPICAKALAKRFPQILVDTTRRIIDYEDIVSAGGFLAWVDIGLFLVDKILGGGVKVETARIVLADPAANETHYSAGFAPTQMHGDRAVLKAQQLVHMRDGRSVSLASMAAAAGLERRTFLRRFVNATGMAPIEYSRAVRMARARELLKGGNTSQKMIAQSIGYKDVASFARVFRKATGLAPGAYRKKFGLNGALPLDSTWKGGSPRERQIPKARIQMRQKVTAATG
jgi:transcriptional regulator GlxA family with amidase domain